MRGVSWFSSETTGFAPCLRRYLRIATCLSSLTAPAREVEYLIRETIKATFSFEEKVQGSFTPHTAMVHPSPSSH